MVQLMPNNKCYVMLNHTPFFSIKHTISMNPVRIKIYPVKTAESLTTFNPGPQRFICKNYTDRLRMKLISGMNTLSQKRNTLKHVLHKSRQTSLILL